MNLTKSQLAIVTQKAEELNKQYPKWRKGQSFFNALVIEFPAAAETIRATQLDMFYNDETINKFKNSIL